MDKRRVNLLKRSCLARSQEEILGLYISLKNATVSLAYLMRMR